MDDVKQNLRSSLTRSHQHVHPRRLETGRISADSDTSSFVIRPHISLKARMLGGQAETIMRLGGLTR